MEGKHGCAVDSASRWSAEERVNLLNRCVEKARELEEHDTAADAYRILAKQDGKAGEEAQTALVKMLADEAEYMKVSMHLTNQRYAETKTAFQRVVDFYPDDAYADKARKFLEKLQTLNLEAQ